MTIEHKTAMARIISDMIKADNIIEEKEICSMQTIMKHYSISQKNMSDARKIRFSDAVNILQELPLPERESFLQNIYSLSLSDNVCVPKEVLLLIALQYCLVTNEAKDKKGKRVAAPYLVSCPTTEFSMNDQYMVYLESSFDKERNNEILRDFELLVMRSRINGFNFVYIPKMVEEFCQMDSKYVQDVIRYMAPHLDETIVSDVYGRLCNMSTETFFRNVLYEKLQVKALHNAKPSLLINIGTSVVPYCNIDGSVQYYSEFLCIPIVNDTLSLVTEVLDFYKKKVSLHSITITENQGQFKYFGFYKALFDFLIAPPPAKPDLIFLGQNNHTKRYAVAFRFADNSEITLQLTPKRYNLYFDIAIKSYFKGQKGMPVTQVDRTSISHLRNLISECLGTKVSYLEDYKPERKGNSIFLRLEPEKVYRRFYSHDATHYKDVQIMRTTENMEFATL